MSLDLSPEDTERLAKAALGLTLQDAENAFARAIVSDGQLSLNDLDVILEEKRQIIQKTEILEFVKSDVGLADVGGLGNLKRWLRKCDKSWLDSARRYNCLPKGCSSLACGCGKSTARLSAWLGSFRCCGWMWARSSAASSAPRENIAGPSRPPAIAPSVLWIDRSKRLHRNEFIRRQRHVRAGFRHIPHLASGKDTSVFVVATSTTFDTPPELLRKDASTRYSSWTYRH